MIIDAARNNLLIELKNIYDRSEALNIAELVIENISGFTRSELIIHKDFLFSNDQIEKLGKIISRLKENEPVQYVLGEAWFAGMKYNVNKNVLIPRPETEELVEWAVKEIQNSKFKIQNLLDIGTGSGCIPITIKKKCTATSVSAIDVCSEAIFTATENAVDHNTEIDFILMDFLDEDKWNDLGKYDIIISNPPYIRQREISTMHKRVTSHEPHLALFVPDDDALLFYRKLADFSLLHLKAGGKLFVEINESLGKEVVDIFKLKGFASVEIRKDMQGKERMLKSVLYL